MPAHRRNLELKVPVTDAELTRLERRLPTLAGAPLERIHQVDTYLAVPSGRLKVRELRSHDGTPLRAELIAYARPDVDGSRWSEYEVISVSATDAPNLLRGLLLTHPRLARVAKARTVGHIDHTRVHLDRVENLGAFVELETVIAGQPEPEAENEHRKVIAALGLDSTTAIRGSYSDLVIGQSNRSQPE